MDSAGSRYDWISGTAGVATGVGILMFVLFPFAVPIVVLSILVMLPLALPLIAVAAIAAILTGAWLGIRAGGRGIRRLGRGPGVRGITPAQADSKGRGALHRASGGPAASGPRP